MAMLNNQRVEDTQFRGYERNQSPNLGTQPVPRSKQEVLPREMAENWYYLGTLVEPTQRLFHGAKSVGFIARLARNSSFDRVDSVGSLFIVSRYKWQKPKYQTTAVYINCSAYPSPRPDPDC